MDLVELQHVKVYFRERVGLLKVRVTKALDDVSLKIGEGEVVAVIGESGAGKTTLGRVILGLQKPTSGRALFMGKDIYALRGRDYVEYRRSVQWVPQDPYSSLDPSLTIGEQLMAPIRRWFSPDDALPRALELLRLVGLTPPEFYMNKYPHQLSGGQRQRVAIARAMATEPKLIIADEPLTMIDSSLRVGIVNVFAGIRQVHNLAILFITHDIALARLFIHKMGGGRAIVMREGRIVEEGDIDEIVANPKSEYTKLLISAAPDLKRALSQSG